MRSINKSGNVENFSTQIIILYFRVKKYMKLSVVRLEICMFCFIALEMSFPHVFSGNPGGSGFTGYPIKAFGYDKTVNANF
ncbi:hypothetical protein B188_17270 [Candidatus Brocadiaceae bacterium B188]|nr:hypothetical protein B188_17270 [Candidatus Brocadiaceae bacterium B188]